MVPGLVGCTVVPPLVASLPDQSASAGEAVAAQEAAFVVVQLKLTELPSVIEVGLAFNVTVGGVGELMTIVFAYGAPNATPSYASVHDSPYVPGLPFKLPR